MTLRNLKIPKPAPAFQTGKPSKGLGGRPLRGLRVPIPLDQKEDAI